MKSGEIKNLLLLRKLKKHEENTTFINYQFEFYRF